MLPATFLTLFHCLLFSSLHAHALPLSPRQATGKSTSVTTVHTTNTSAGLVTETCIIVFTPIKDAQGNDAVREVRTCSIKMDPTSQSGSITATATSASATQTATDPATTTHASTTKTHKASTKTQTKTATDSATQSASASASATVTDSPASASATDAPSSSATTSAAQTTDSASATASATDSSSAASSSATASPSSSAGSGAVVIGLSSVPVSGTASATATASTTAASPSATGGTGATVIGITNVPNTATAQATDTAFPVPVTTLVVPSGPISDAGSSPTTAPAGTGTAVAATESSEAPQFQLPGKKLSVLPIGLGVFAGISVIALIVVGLVTYERTKYRKAFRQRKLAESAAPMGYGGAN